MPLPWPQARSLMLHWYGRENAMWVDACCVQASALKALGDLRTAEKMLRRCALLRLEPHACWRSHHWHGQAARRK